MKSYLQRLGALTCFILSYTAQASSVPELVTSAIPGAAKVGEARYSYLFWDVYDARLFAPQGKWQPQESFALALTYLRDFDGANRVDDRPNISTARKPVDRAPGGPGADLLKGGARSQPGAATASTAA